jgi:hypothetical protein
LFAFQCNSFRKSSIESSVGDIESDSRDKAGISVDDDVGSEVDVSDVASIVDDSEEASDEVEAWEDVEDAVDEGSSGTRTLSPSSTDETFTDSPNEVPSESNSASKSSSSLLLALPPPPKFGSCEAKFKRPVVERGIW